MRTPAGFSLIEVMCAVAILAIAIVGLTQGITTALSSSKEAELQTRAALLAAGQIEELRAEGLLTDGESSGEGGDGLSLFRWKQTISSTAIEGLHDVTVVVENTRTDKAVYELRTLLFETPGDSSADSGRSGSSRSAARRGRQ
jgi:general secretion pathway protein I